MLICSTNKFSCTIVVLVISMLICSSVVNAYIFLLNGILMTCLQHRVFLRLDEIPKCYISIDDICTVVASSQLFRSRGPQCFVQCAKLFVKLYKVVYMRREHRRVRSGFRSLSSALSALRGGGHFKSEITTFPSAFRHLNRSQTALRASK